MLPFCFLRQIAPDLNRDRSCITRPKENATQPFSTNLLPTRAQHVTPMVWQNEAILLAENMSEAELLEAQIWGAKKYDSELSST